MTNDNRQDELQASALPVALKLSLLWTMLMVLYIYNDYLSLYMPGMIEMMTSGSLGPLGPVTDMKMVAIAIILVIPAAMIVLSSLLPARASRAANIVFGILYTAIAALTSIGAPAFYTLIVVVEFVGAVTILFLALRWPRVGSLTQA